MLVVGEVDTGLLRGRDASASDDGQSLVDLIAGERVLVSTRPQSYVRSADRLVGVDCPLGAGQPRGLGTAVQRTAITGNEAVQGSAYAMIVRAEHTARRPWSYYLARPGCIEVIGRPRWGDISGALAAPERARDALDLGAIAQRATDEVQNAARGGPEEAFRAIRARLRWVAVLDDDVARHSGVQFEVFDRRLRLLRFRAGSGTSPVRLAAACEDVALHDWLVSTLIESVRKSAIGCVPRGETIRRLRPAVDHLLHLWMPAARADELTEELWRSLERRAGFSRQWHMLVTRVRDQFSIAMAESLATSALRKAP